MPLIVVPLQLTPVGRPVTLVIVPLVAVISMSVIALFIHTVCTSLVTVTSGNGLTLIVAVVVASPQSGVLSLLTVTVTSNVPLTVGVPLIVVPLQLTPVGRPVTLVIVPLVAVISMSVIALFIHTVCTSLVTVTSGNGFTVSVNAAVAPPQFGLWLLVTVTVTSNVPLTVGVPLIVVLPSHVTPAGRPSTLVIVALVAVMVMASIAVPLHTFWASLVTDTSGNGLTLIVTYAFASPQSGVLSLLTVTVTSNVPLTDGVPLIVVPLQLTPAGSPSTLVMFALVAVMVMASIAVPLHTVWTSLLTVTSGNGLTVSVNSASAAPQP